MSDKIKEYKTCKGTTPTKLDNEVETAIKEGFQPFGNPYSGIYGKDTGLYCQAVVKYVINWRAGLGQRAAK